MILSSQRFKAFAPLLRRLVAIGSVALVLMMGASVVLPALHHWLHGDAGEETSDQCAVEMFGMGITTASSSLALERQTITWPAPVQPAQEALFLATPRFLRQPERGPPLS